MFKIVRFFLREQLYGLKNIESRTEDFVDERQLKVFLEKIGVDKEKVIEEVDKFEEIYVDEKEKKVFRKVSKKGDPLLDNIREFIQQETCSDEEIYGKMIDDMYEEFLNRSMEEIR